MHLKADYCIARKWEIAAWAHIWIIKLKYPLLQSILNDNKRYRNPTLRHKGLSSTSKSRYFCDICNYRICSYVKIMACSTVMHGVENMSTNESDNRFQWIIIYVYHVHGTPGRRTIECILNRISKRLIQHGFNGAQSEMQDVICSLYPPD